MPPGPDVLVAGNERPRPRRRRRRAALAVLAVLVVGALLADRELERREFEQLLSRAETGRDAVVYADRRLAATLQYVRPVLGSADAAPEVQRDVRRLVREEASEQAVQLARRERELRAASVLPWHGAARDARDAWADYLDARADLFADAGDDLRALGTPRPDLERLRRTGVQAFERAAPDGAAVARVRVALDPAPVSP